MSPKKDSFFNDSPSIWLWASIPVSDSRILFVGEDPYLPYASPTTT